MQIQISLLNETGNESATIVHSRNDKVQLQSVLDLNYTSSVVITDYQNGDEIHIEAGEAENVETTSDETTDNTNSENTENKDLTGSSNPDNLEDA